MRTTWQLWIAAAVLGSTPALACNSDPGCTEIGCEHEAIVTFPPNLVSSGYTLLLEGESGMAVARCLDPGSPEAAENPEGLTCDASGFTLLGHPLANERELLVTVMPDDTDPVTQAVRLDAVGENTPNGPDCPPICFIRNGQLVLGGNG